MRPALRFLLAAAPAGPVGRAEVAPALPAGKAAERAFPAFGSKTPDLSNPVPSNLNRAGWAFLIAQLDFKDGWVNRGSELKDRWLHSDINDVAYRYNHKVYEKTIEGSQLNTKP